MDTPGPFTIDFGDGSLRGHQVYGRLFAIDSRGCVGYSTLQTFIATCLVRGTPITVRTPCGGTVSKPIEDITYDDELLTWDFETGKPAFARPAWIKAPQRVEAYTHLVFADGRTLDIVNGHRLLSSAAGAFVPAPCLDAQQATTSTAGRLAVGDHVQAMCGGDSGTCGSVALKSATRVDEPVDCFNVLTRGHLNMCANGILVSCQLNNRLPICCTTMRFVGGPEKELVPHARELFDAIPASLVSELGLCSCTHMTAEAIVELVTRFAALTLPC